MNYEQIDYNLDTAITFIGWTEEEIKKDIDWNDTEAVDLSYGLQEVGGRLLKIRHELCKKYKKEQQWENKQNSQD